MKKTLGLIALAALVMLASCKKNEQTTGTKLTAGIEQNKSNSKTSLNDLTITWSAGDQLYVNNGTDAACFTLTSNPGATTGEFATSDTYTFADNNVAVYPYNEDITVGNNKVTMTLPAVQTASTSETFGNGANPMLGKFTNPANIQLTSLCGVLCLQLRGDNVEITDIKIEGGADDKLNGTFEADYTVTSPVLTKTGDDGTNAVTLHLQETTTLTSTAKKFYVVLPAVTLTNGFTMKVYNGTNEIFSQSTTASLNIPVNTVESMNTLEVTPTAATWDGNLSTLTGSEPAGYATATDGMTITGTLTVNSVKVSIADGANLTLQDATINGQSFSSYNYAGLNLLGSANITLVGTSTMSGGNEKAGIYAPEGGTLTISGDGTINATGGEYAAGIGSNYLGSSGDIVITNGSATINATGGYAGAGIGSGYKAASECGNIEITDSFTGTVNATGHYGSPGIGSGNRSDCVNITISGGTINATGEDGGAPGNGAPGIGSGIDGSCGIININDGVTLVTAVKGNSAPCCIGKGSSATCGTINIGGTVYSDGVDANQGDGVTYIYPYAAPTVPEGIVNGLYSVSATKQVWFSKGNLQYQVPTGNWRFAEHQWDYCQTSNGAWNCSNWIDYFTWGTWTGSNPNPLETSNIDESIYTFAATDFDQTLHGSDAWRTLTIEEWYYLFYERASGATVTTTSGTTNNARFAKATINTNVASVNGLILFPDGVTIASNEATTWGTINDIENEWGTKCTSAQWTDLEYKGCVFLPAAGDHHGNGNSPVTAFVVGTWGFYWSSSNKSAQAGYCVYFWKEDMRPIPTNTYYDSWHSTGMCVRLVQDYN